jgi:hypothetical protein
MASKPAPNGALWLHSDTLIFGLGRFAAGEHAVGEAEGQIPAEVAQRLVERGQASAVPLAVKEEENAR